MRKLFVAFALFFSFFVLSLPLFSKDVSAICVWVCGNSAGDSVTCGLGTSRCPGSPPSRCQPTNNPACQNNNDSSSCFAASNCNWCEPSRDFTQCCTTDNECSYPPTGGQGGSSVGSADTTCSADGGTGIKTAIGCIPVENTQSFAGWILRWAIGIAGGVAFILIIVSGFMITTSSGDPKRLQAGRELLTSAIAGLLLVIFATFILRLIGVDILGLFA